MKIYLIPAVFFFLTPLFAQSDLQVLADNYKKEGNNLNIGFSIPSEPLKVTYNLHKVLVVNNGNQIEAKSLIGTLTNLNSGSTHEVSWDVFSDVLEIQGIDRVIIQLKYTPSSLELLALEEKRKQQALEKQNKQEGIQKKLHFRENEKRLFPGVYFESGLLEEAPYDNMVPIIGLGGSLDFKLGQKWFIQLTSSLRYSMGKNNDFSGSRDYSARGYDKYNLSFSAYGNTINLLLFNSQLRFKYNGFFLGLGINHMLQAYRKGSVDYEVNWLDYRSDADVRNQNIAETLFLISAEKQDFDVVVDKQEYFELFSDSPVGSLALGWENNPKNRLLLSLQIEFGTSIIENSYALNDAVFGKLDWDIIYNNFIRSKNADDAPYNEFYNLVTHSDAMGLFQEQVAENPSIIVPFANKEDNAGNLLRSFSAQIRIGWRF